MLMMMMFIRGTMGTSSAARYYLFCRNLVGRYFGGGHGFFFYRSFAVVFPFIYIRHCLILVAAAAAA